MFRAVCALRYWAVLAKVCRKRGQLYFRGYVAAVQEKRRLSKLVRKTKKGKGRKKKEAHALAKEDLAKVPDALSAVPPPPPLGSLPWGHDLPDEILRGCAPLEQWWAEEGVPREVGEAAVTYWRDGPAALDALRAHCVDRQKHKVSGGGGVIGGVIVAVRWPRQWLSSCRCCPALAPLRPARRRPGSTVAAPPAVAPPAP